MTVAATDFQSGPYTPNGVTTTFAYDFRIGSAAEIMVVRRDADGVETEITTGFSVTGAGTASGNIVFDTAPAAGNPIYIYGDPVFSQAVALVGQGSYSPASVEEGLDRAMLRDAKQQEELDRSIKVRRGSAPIVVDDYETLLADASDAIGADVLADIETAGTTQVGLVNTAGTTQVTAVETAADLVLDAVTGTLPVAEAAALVAITDQEALSVAAVATEGDTQVARVAATPGSTMYADTTAGLAGTASGGYFLVAGSGETVATVYKDNAGVAEIQEAYPSVEYVADVDRRASYAAFDLKRKAALLDRPKALVLVFTGQSNNARRGTAISTITSTDAYMPNAGNNPQQWQMYATNAEHTVIYADVASATTHTEGASETPLSGAITTAIGGVFARIYTCSVAIGSRSLAVLAQGGPRCNLYAVVDQMCDFARAAGYDPIVAYDTAHGEAEMAAGTTETDYYNNGLSYYGMCQLVAAQAMERPDYVAPIVIRIPIQNKDGTDGATSRGIANAIRRLGRDIPNAIFAGGNYHFDSESDRIHQEETGMRARGEQTGHLLRRLFSEGVRERALEVVDVTWSGTTATFLFNEEITVDTNFTWGENLDTTNACSGVQWFDNGSQVVVSSVVASGRKLVATLGSTPVGTAAQQVWRIASQTTSATLTSGLTNRSGSQIRVNDSGRKQIYSSGDATYGIDYRWATPQTGTARAA